MRRRLLIAAVFALVLSAVGCGDDSGGDAGGTFTPRQTGVLTSGHVTSCAGVLGRSRRRSPDRRLRVGHRDRAREAVRARGGLRRRAVRAAGGTVDEGRVESLNDSLAGRGYDTKVIVRVDRSMTDGVANAALGQKATIAIVPTEAPGLEAAVFGAEEDRLAQQIAVPVLFAIVMFDVAGRFAKAGHPVGVWAAAPVPADRLSHLGGAEVVVGDDRVAYAREQRSEHSCLTVPGPGGTSVFGDDIASLAGVGAGLLIAVGSAGEEDAAKLVTMGRNLGAGRMHTA